MAKQDDLEAWLDSDAEHPPETERVYNGMTDEELSQAICRVAIGEGIDPNDHGVIPDAEILEESDSAELAYKLRLKASLAMAVAQRLGVSYEQSAKIFNDHRGMALRHDSPRAAAVLSGGPLLPPTMDLLAEAVEDHGLALPEMSAADKMANAISAADQYDKWLRPVLVFLSTLFFSAGVGLSAPSTLFLLFVNYGFFCDGFSPRGDKKQKAIGPK